MPLKNNLGQVLESGKTVNFLKKYQKFLSLSETNNELQKSFLSGFNGHMALFTIQKTDFDNKDNFCVDITTLTTYKNNDTINVIPYKHKLMPEILIKNGFQGLAGTTQQFFCNYDFLYKKLHLDPKLNIFEMAFFNETNFHGMGIETIDGLKTKVKQDNIFFLNNNYEFLNQYEINFFRSLLISDLSCPLEVKKGLWSFFSKEKYTYQQSTNLLLEACSFLKNQKNANFKKILNQSDSLLQNINPYQSPYYKKNDSFDSLMENLIKTNTRLRNSGSSASSFPVVSRFPIVTETDFMDKS